MSKHVILRFNLLIKNDLRRKTKSRNYLLARVKNVLFTYLFQGLSKLPVLFLNITFMVIPEYRRAEVYYGARFIRIRTQINEICPQNTDFRPSLSPKPVLLI